MTYHIKKTINSAFLQNSTIQNYRETIQKKFLGMLTSTMTEKNVSNVFSLYRLAESAQWAYKSRAFAVSNHVIFVRTSHWTFTFANSGRTHVWRFGRGQASRRCQSARNLSRTSGCPTHSS